jgi:proton-translocating NADH-quinone oxidoreductase chain M
MMSIFDSLVPLFLIPFIGFLFLMFSKNNLREIALGTATLEFLESLRIWSRFDYGSADFQFSFKVYWMTDYGFFFGIDGISLFFVVLTTFLIPICLLASWDTILILRKEYLLCFIGMEFLLMGVFTILDLLGFYMFFEGVLIPMFLIIGVWGAREEKIRASYYFFFYTLVGSVLMLLSIFYIYLITGSTDYLTLLNYSIDENLQIIIFLCFFASLAVKIPKFPFHIWLPLAHVEAPVAGSVILAGILIKLGAYGFIRFSLPLLPHGCEFFAPMVLTLACLAIVYASLTTLRQTDLKRVIAYSSVSHMGVVMLSIFSFSVIGVEGSIFLQLAHGLVSSALFIVVTLLYERHHTRIIKYYRGVAVTMPLYSIMFFILTLANIAVPLSANFVGEFLSLLAVFQINPFLTIVSCAGVILSAAYALFLYNRVCFGAMSTYIKHSVYSRDLTRREFLVLLPLVALTLVLGVYPNLVLDPMHASVIKLFVL